MVFFNTYQTVKLIFLLQIFSVSVNQVILDVDSQLNTVPEEDVEHILDPNDVPVTTSGPVKIEIIGDTTHLFADEDFRKKEVVLLYDQEENNKKSESDNENTPTKEENPSNDQSNPINLTNIYQSNNNKKSNSSANPHADCLNSNLTEYREDNKVQLVNGSRLTQILSESKNNECFLVLFYVPWCPFSANLAPIYNAIPKAFNNLDILAFDVSKSIGYNTKFGTSAVPMILLFQHKNVLAKFNYTQKNITDYIEFISNKTGFKGNKSVVVTEEDLEGPVPTVAIKSFDYYLFISWAFLIFVSIDFLIRKTKFKIYVFRFIKRLILLIRPARLMELPQPPQLPMLEQINDNDQNAPRDIQHLHHE